MQRACNLNARQAARDRREAARSRRSWRRSSFRRRQPAGRLEERREDRPERPRHDCGATSPATPAGGSCYNCHQLSPKEASYGTVGPSLRGFGKIRGNAPEIQKYVYGKIYNAKAYNLCSQMPRLGHSGTLTEQQIKDLIALLLDPASPVNQ